MVYKTHIKKYKVVIDDTIESASSALEIMAVASYRFSFLQYDQCRLQFTPQNIMDILKSWRNSHETALVCSKCQEKLVFDTRNFVLCCQQFYYKPTHCYKVESLAIDTRGYEFLLPSLKAAVKRKRIDTRQEFLVLPDPIYWQIATTLVYEKIMKFVMGVPITKKTKLKQPPSKSATFYKQLQETPLNHGSLFKRSGGKNTFFRQLAYGKRCILSLRAMIVPDTRLRPNEITLPHRAQKLFNLLGKWIILNRMPSLLPENFVALRVTRLWNDNCFGIPLEIAELMNADFDGDECNVYVMQHIQSQVECQEILNSERHLGSLTSGLKLSACQDMKVAFYKYYDEIDFLPYKDPEKNLNVTFRVIYDLYGSARAFECIDRMRCFYLDVLQHRTAFALTLQEMTMLFDRARHKTYEQFVDSISDDDDDGCLVTQVRSGAKGSYFHLYQMFGSIGTGRENSFWQGLNANEAITHALTTFDALLKGNKIWQPGYGYSKSVYNMQGIHVDYLGRLVDGNVVLDRDVLNAMKHTDLMSEEAFQELVRQHFLQPLQRS